MTKEQVVKTFQEYLNQTNQELEFKPTKDGGSVMQDEFRVDMEVLRGRNIRQSIIIYADQGLLSAVSIDFKEEEDYDAMDRILADFNKTENLVKMKLDREEKTIDAYAGFDFSQEEELADDIVEMLFNGPLHVLIDFFEEHFTLEEEQ